MGVFFNTAFINFLLRFLTWWQLLSDKHTKLPLQYIKKTNKDSIWSYHITQSPHPRNNSTVLTSHKPSAHSFLQFLAFLYQPGRIPSCFSQQVFRNLSFVIQTYTWTHLLHLNIAVPASTVILRLINFQFFQILNSPFMCHTLCWNQTSDFRKVAVFRLKIILNTVTVPYFEVSAFISTTQFFQTSISQETHQVSTI